MKTVVLRKEDIYQGPLILVNQNYPIQSSLNSKNLVPITKAYPNILLEKTASKTLQTILYKIASSDDIVPVSGYRTNEEQTNIYQTSLKENGESFTKKYVALPKTSEHQTGLAIDLGQKQDNIDFIRPSFPHTGICEEFRQLAYQYGFIERYQETKQAITKIASEEWHFRYVGYPHSMIMKEKNLCLEEYHEYLKTYHYPNNPYTYENYEIFFLPFKQIRQIVNLEDKDTISGNNIDGFIITRKREEVDEKNKYR